MKYINSTLYGLFILMLLGVAGLFLSTLLPIPGNIEMKIVKSGSMEPSIKTGSIVVVKPSLSYAVNDVITFGEDTSRQIPTTHRIIAANGDFKTISYTTKGDANEEQDPAPVSQSDIIGKVVLAIPYAGYILDFARQPIGFTLMIGIPAGIIILDELMRIFGEVRRMRKRDDEAHDSASYFEGLSQRVGARVSAGAAAPDSDPRNMMPSRAPHGRRMLDLRRSV